ncbi:MAG: quinol:cytochrome C oxidoreductase [Bacteroidota bacterium]
MIQDEKYDFTPTAKKRLAMIFIIGVILTISGYIYIANSSSADGDHGDSHGTEHGGEHDYGAENDGGIQSDSYSEVPTSKPGVEVQLVSNSEAALSNTIGAQSTNFEQLQEEDLKANDEATMDHQSGEQESQTETEQEPYGEDLVGQSTTDSDNHHDSGVHDQENAYSSKEVHEDSHSEEIHSEEVHDAHGGHHGASPVKKRFLSNLWINSIFFGGLSIIGVFFFAIQYAAQAGWSAGLKRIPFAFGAWLPIGFITLLGVFLYGSHDIFHWTHADLYTGPEPDKIMLGKASYFFAPLEAGSFPFFWVARLVIFFVVWYFFFRKLRSLAYAEDLDGGTKKWYKLRSTSAIFLVFFAVSSSMAAWDWIMSVDPHWFSTMFGWYVFASWWVSGLALSLFIILFLKDKGLLSVVNENHIHDMGKFVFAFSIFWTYVWFSQFLLIYYAHIPEETIYYLERWKSDHYAPVFFINLILNFFLPFLLLMTRDSKRHSRMLKVATMIIVFGHWIDFYLMISPATVGENGGFGFMEMGIIMMFISAFLYVVFNALSKAPLFAKNHPMLQESLHHHI